MATMTQSDMKKLVSGGSNLFDNDGLEILSLHMATIAIVSLGDDSEHLHSALTTYADELADFTKAAYWVSPETEKAALDYIEWLRAL